MPKLNIYGGLEVRFKTRECTVAEITKGGKVVAQGVAVLKPGEEPDQEVGEKKAFKRALAELFPFSTPGMIQQSAPETWNEICRFWKDRKKWIKEQVQFRSGPNLIPASIRLLLPLSTREFKSLVINNSL